ncbi:MAG: hypothetical protein ACXVCP_14225 [Bdellovibrio sp.]
MKNSSIKFWIFTFCCVAIIAGYISHKKFFLSGSAEFSSKEDLSVINKFNKITESVAQMTPKEDMSCQCKIGDQQDILKFETPEECGEDRNYLQANLLAFKKADPKGMFSAPRDYSKTAAVFPRKCALYIMRTFWVDKARSPEEKREADIEFNRTATEDKKREIKDISKYNPDPDIYAKCKNPDGVPERYGNKACVTEDYVNLVYNSLMDVSDCLDISPKFIAPKLSTESGFHVNAFGLVNDGGIGQFTDSALKDIKENYEKFKRKIIQNKSRESCNRIANFPGALPKDSEEIKTADENRCHVIASPPNPLRSLIYYAILFHSTKKYSDNAFDRQEDSKDPNFRTTKSLMDEAEIGDFDLKPIKDMLFVMSYNTGPKLPSTIFREWLKYRIDFKKKNPSFFKKNSSKKNIDSEHAITIADLNTAYWPTKDQVIMINTKKKNGDPLTKDERADVLLANKKIPVLTFPEYLYAYQNSRYIAAVKTQARILDKELGAGVCTEQKFLEL